MPATISQNGSEVKPCSAMATQPCQCSASAAMAGCLSANTVMTPLKYSPVIIESAAMAPMMMDGMASSTSGTVTTQGDSCGT